MPSRVLCSSTIQTLTAMPGVGQLAEHVVLVAELFATGLMPP